MKNILLPIFQGVIVRNILRTGVIDKLIRSNNVRVILLIDSEDRAKYLQQYFNYPNLIFEVVERHNSSLLDFLFNILKHNLLNTNRIDIRRKIYLNESGNKFIYCIKKFFAIIFARKFYRKIVRLADLLLVRDKNYRDIFLKYKPDMILSAHIFSDREISMIRFAKKAHIKSVGIINSWDKITSRHMIRILPDKMIVHNDLIKKEAIKYADMNARDIIVTGVPHYDMFISGKVRDKEYFYSKFKIDLSRKILLFCPTGQYYSNQDKDIINMLIRLRNDKLIPSDMHIFVRFPPNDIVDINGIGIYDNVTFYQPGIRFNSKRGIDWDMNDEDIQLLHDNLFWSSLVICPPSSISIDAAILDKPIINLCLGDKYQYKTDNINLYYESDHYKNILRHDGIKMVYSEKELVDVINFYIKYPDTDRDGRRKIALEQAWKLDGLSSQRMADAIASVLSEN
jgi:CDP-glycerol glycerophosphotransferase (TagB/SpsB family)